MNYDYIVIGAGIVGLTIARELIKKYPAAKVAVLEKEQGLGVHASGLNSGVLHSGIYYPPNSLKANLCVRGFDYLKDYCLENKLYLNQCGKVVVCANEQDEQSLDMIHERATKNNVPNELIDSKQLKDLEPYARSAVNKALWVPGTSVFNPKEILFHIKQELLKSNVDICLNQQVVDIDPKTSIIRTKDNTYSYGHVFNTAGLFADFIASKYDLNQYTILPFKGIYYYLTDSSKYAVKKLIYPAPDINLPFLGVHVTMNAYNEITLGPSATPALGRENYQGLMNINFKDFSNISIALIKQYIQNKNNFRAFAHNELMNFLSKDVFLNNIKKIMPALEHSDISSRKKVGIRAQLLDVNKQELIMDLLVEKRNNSTHVLNAVSPAFTCSFALARYLINNDT